MECRPYAALIAACCLALASTSISAAADDPEKLAFFENQVRPLLVKHCYSCHSHEAETLRGNLYLDNREGWEKGGDSGPAVIPGKPDESPVVTAVRYGDDGFQMPPAGKLAADEIATLERWVADGAIDPRTAPVNVARAARTIDVEAGRRWWAFQPLRQVSPPHPAGDDWSITPVDGFIVTALHAQGLTPRAPVDRRRLCRRVYFDLIGLPPSPEEVEAFVADTAPDAYERLVDRLLSSPHYGERWARHWLDLVRFAESHGFEHDYDREYAYHYRDFVIRALNEDLPYDRFVQWQLAGDELAPDDPLALAATGFLAAGVHATQITANQVEKERYDELDDMLNTTGTALLGLTLGCARCHDHKFDPIPSSDYYRMLSVFTTTVRANLDVNLDPSGFAAQRARFDAEHAPFEAAVARYAAEQLPAALEQWLAEPSAATQPVWTVLVPERSASAGGATLVPQPDGSVLLSGNNPDKDTLTFVLRTDQVGLTSLKVEALADPSFPAGGPGRAPNGNIQLTDVRVEAAPASGEGAPVLLVWTAAAATFEQNDQLAVRLAIDGDKSTGWAVDGQLGRDHAAVFTAQDDFGFSGGTVLTVTLDFQGNTQHIIGRPRFSISCAARPAPLDGLVAPAAIQSILASRAASASAELSDADRQTLLAWYKPLDAGWRELRRQADEHLRQAPQPQTAKMLVSSEGVPAIRLHTQGGDFLDATHFLKRGDPNQKLDVATPAYLQVLTSAPNGENHWHRDPPAGWRTSYRRAALANWLTDPQFGAGSLLARVIVNRLWQHHLGRGIVATPSDFGAQGAPPSHPELLDWLAEQLIAGGWQLKPLHRLILTSAVYRQDSAYDEHAATIDPDNQWYWRFRPRRIEGEAVRDTLLALSGTWDRRMYGPGTLDLTQRRRSIYFTVKRSQMVPWMLVFDAPDGVTGLAQRPVTTVAPQALLLLNNPVAYDLAGQLAARVSTAAEQPVTDEQAVRNGFLLALQRQPTADELQGSLAFLAAQAKSYRQANHADPARAALTDFCHTLFGLNELIYVD
ncbi:MAG: PSD1 and planctomycete cytochrome C domain-containing protein [Pirellulales bacterium]|nr:PSD1 and planctomycete cytochrome C domain-containing protein [Pirellulales bacterium]